MKGYDPIRELYHGNLHPCDRSFRSDTRFAAAMEAFTSHENWFRKKLSEEDEKRFDELIACHNEINGTVSYENFRTGFQLGVLLVMEAVSEPASVFFEL